MRNSSLNEGPSIVLQRIVYVMILAIGMSLSFILKIDAPIVPQDEGILITYPDLILRGYVPYRDFAPIYPPGNFYVIAGAFRLFGSTLIVERGVGAAYGAILAFILFFLGRRISETTGVIAAMGSQGMLHMFPCPAAISMVGAIGFLSASVLAANFGFSKRGYRGAFAWCVISGLSVGLAAWFRLEIGVVAFIASLVALRPHSKPQFFWFCSGSILPLAGLAVFAVSVGPQLFFDSLVMDVIRSGPGRLLPLEFRPLMILLLMCVVINVVLTVSIRGNIAMEGSVWLVRAFGVVSVLMLPSVLQRADIWHITYVGAVVLPMAVISLSIWFRSISSTRKRTRRVAMWAIGVPALVCFVLDYGSATSFYSRESEVLAVGGRWVFESLPHGGDGGGQPSLQDVKALFNEVSIVSRPGERVFIGPRDLRFAMYNDTYFYFLLPWLRPASRYLETNPGGSNHNGSSLAGDLARADWIIQTSRYDSWKEPNASSEPGPNGPNQVVDRLFCVHSAHGVWRLLQRCVSE